MTKQMEALRMLNLAFESHDGAPVMQAIITQADYRLLFEALTEQTPPPMRWNPNTSSMEPFNYSDDQKASR